MTAPEDRDAIRAMIRRATLLAIDDSESQQRLKLRGLKSEQLDKVVRVQDFGFHSSPPDGAEGLLLALGGRSDRAMALGFEHKAHRPKNRPAGSTAIYDAPCPRVGEAETRPTRRGLHPT